MLKAQAGNRLHTPASNLGILMRNYSRVIYALILHDIKSRFFGNGWGQVLLILWPFVHMVFLVGAYTVSGRTVPFGSSLLLFACTGAIPWIVFSYMSRWIAFSPSSNRSLLNYPIVMPLDLVFSRALLEIAVNAIVVALALVVLVMMGDDPWPNDVTQAACALAACVLLAFSVGVFNAAIVLMFNLWASVYILILILLYILSGLLFIPSALPENVRYYMGLNPLLQDVEWMRSAYYPDYPTLVLDKLYPIKFGFITLAVGLLLERFARRFVARY